MLDYRMDATGKTGASRPRPGIVKRVSHASRLGLKWGLAGLLLGALIGGAAGLWLAMQVNALYGIGGDNYSGPLSQTPAQEAWVYVKGLGLGVALVGGLLAVVCGLMGCVWGIVEGQPASSEKAEPEERKTAEQNAAAARPRD
jgi:hypothetical protein